MKKKPPGESRDNAMEEHLIRRAVLSITKQLRCFIRRGCSEIARKRILSTLNGKWSKKT